MTYRSEVRAVDQYLQKLETTVRSDQEVNSVALNHIDTMLLFECRHAMRKD